MTQTTTMRQPATSPPALERRRILVVDDVAANVRLMTAQLIAAGHDVMTANNGEQALERIQCEAPDLVLLDIMMPGLDGFEVCRIVKDDPLSCHIPIILLTSLIGIEHKTQGQQVGADEFISKPIDTAELMLRVEAMLRIKSLHDELAAKIDELERAKRELRRLANTDGLTGLYNVRYLEQLLPREMGRAKRYDRELSLLMLDIDHFKQVNDRHGHRTGDVLLQQLAGLFVSSVRDIDVAARYGGEEFVLVLLETGSNDAAGVAEKLRRHVAESEFHDDRGQSIGPVRVSIGVATWPGDAAGTRDLLEAADRRLYRAKQGGRNRVVASDD